MNQCQHCFLCFMNACVLQRQPAALIYPTSIIYHLGLISPPSPLSHSSFLILFRPSCPSHFYTYCAIVPLQYVLRSISTTVSMNFPWLHPFPLQFSFIFPLYFPLKPSHPIGSSSHLSFPPNSIPLHIFPFHQFYSPFQLSFPPNSVPLYSFPSHQCCGAETI